MIGPGPDDDIRVHENAYFTVDANGECTAVQENVQAYCDTNP